MPAIRKAEQTSAMIMTHWSAPTSAPVTNPTPAVMIQDTKHCSDRNIFVDHNMEEASQPSQAAVTPTIGISRASLLNGGGHNSRNETINSRTKAIRRCGVP